MANITVQKHQLTNQNSPMLYWAMFYDFKEEPNKTTVVFFVLKHHTIWLSFQMCKYHLCDWVYVKVKVALHCIPSVGLNIYKYSIQYFCKSECSCVFHALTESKEVSSFQLVKHWCILPNSLQSY